jgi:hypothetical protein
LKFDSAESRQVFSVNDYGIIEQFFCFLIASEASPGIPAREKIGLWKVALDASQEPLVIIIARRVVRPSLMDVSGSSHDLDILPRYDNVF